MRLKTAMAILPRLFGADSYLRTAGYIFVVGHMRCYSSLLTHILGSHPLVAGYAEMHQKYRNALDLLELNRKVERSAEKRCAHRYVLDKILHPQVLAPRVLCRNDLRVILMAREPQQTLASILRIRSGGMDSVDRAIDYYVERMSTLRKIAEARRGELLYLDGELLVERTDATLADLSGHLQLPQPLKAEYSVFRLTGVPKYGDPSEWIKSGRVVARRNPLPKIDLTASQSERLGSAYEAMRQFMKQRARVALLKQRTEIRHPPRRAA